MLRIVIKALYKLGNNKFVEKTDGLLSCCVRNDRKGKEKKGGKVKCY